jgi:hypothetical protein
MTTGRKDNFAPDRPLGDVIRQTLPEVQMMVGANRDFMLRATRCLVKTWESALPTKASG